MVFRDQLLKALDSLTTIDTYAYDQLITLLKHTHHQKNAVIISGVGKTGLIGSLFASGLKSIGMNAFFIHPTEAAHGDLGALCLGDVVCIITKSGQSQEVFTLIDYAKAQGLAIIVIAMNADCYPMRVATHPLLLPTCEEAAPVTALPSVSNVVFVALLEQLKIALASSIALTTEQFVRTHPGGKIGRTHTLVTSVLRSGEALPIAYLDTPFAQVVAIISAKKCGCVLVCKRQPEDTKSTTGAILRGIITDGDIRRLAADQPAQLSQLTAAECMHYDPITLEDDASIEAALLVMAEQGVNQLPIVSSSGRLCGVVHIGDVIRTSLSNFDVTMDRQ